MGYACRILADSISPAGHRLTTFEGTFPRIVLAEVNTHCMLGRCSASSRAVPVAKRIAAVVADPFVPESFGRNRGGMQPGEALEGDEAAAARRSWAEACKDAVVHAGVQSELGVHKQYANRLLEPFSWHTAVITATDLDNFFHLRVNPDAQGEFQTFARMMLDARGASEPRALNYGEWHLPYVEPGEAFDLEVQGVAPWKVSIARCARVSTLTQDGVRDVAKDVALHDDRLLVSGHMSPLEHVARPMNAFELQQTRAWDVAIDDGPILRVRWREARVGQEVVWPDATRGVVTFARGPLYYAAKYNGWVSRRQFVHGEHDILGHRAAL